MWRGADDELAAGEDNSTVRRFGSGLGMWWSIAIRPPDDDPATGRDLAAASCYGWATEVCDPIHLDCRPRILQMRLGPTQHSHA